MTTYRIVRFFAPHLRRRAQRSNLPTGLILEEAQAHCQNPETTEKQRVTWSNGVREEVVKWFDSYEKE